MNKLIFGLVALANGLWMSVTHAAPTMIRLEEAIEANALSITLDNTSNGFVTGKLCDECETIRVTVTPDTRAVANNVFVPLAEAKKRAGKPALVIFDAKTLKVKEIRW